jgi:hypothetical protein
MKFEINAGERSLEVNFSGDANQILIKTEEKELKFEAENWVGIHFKRSKQV